MTVRSEVDVEAVLQHSFREVIETMVGLSLTGPRSGGSQPGFHVTSMIGLAGPDFRGLIRISCSSRAARKLAGALLGGEDLLDADPSMLQDGMGELANMIGGTFKREIDAGGVRIDLSLPSTVEGDGILRSISAAANYTHCWTVDGEDVELALIYSDK
jgi:CheY-specific phosphatase CheX